MISVLMLIILLLVPVISVAIIVNNIDVSVITRSEAIKRLKY